LKPFSETTTSSNLNDLEPSTQWGRGVDPAGFWGSPA